MWEKIRQAIRQFSVEQLGLVVEKTNLEQKKDKDGIDVVKATIVLTGTKEMLELAAATIPDSILSYGQDEDEDPELSGHVD